MAREASALKASGFYSIRASGQLWYERNIGSLPIKRCRLTVASGGHAAALMGNTQLPVQLQILTLSVHPPVQCVRVPGCSQGRRIAARRHQRALCLGARCIPCAAPGTTPWRPAAAAASGSGGRAASGLPAAAFARSVAAAAGRQSCGSRASATVQRRQQCLPTVGDGAGGGVGPLLPRPPAVGETVIHRRWQWRRRYDIYRRLSPCPHPL